VNEVVYVDRVEAAWPRLAALQPGSHVPIHCTPAASCSWRTCPRGSAGACSTTRPSALQREDDTDPARLENELTRIRKTRISTDDEGYLAGLISVAVPVLGRDRRMIAAVAVHAPSARMSLRQALGHVALLKGAASELGRIYRQFK